MAGRDFALRALLSAAHYGWAVRGARVEDADHCHGADNVNARARIGGTVGVVGDKHGRSGAELLCNP